MTEAEQRYNKVLKSWYVVQTMRDNQSSWWDVEARIAINGNEDSLQWALHNVRENAKRYPEDAHRLIIRTEQQLAIFDADLGDAGTNRKATK